MPPCQLLAGLGHRSDSTERPPYDARQPSRCEGLMLVVEPRSAPGSVRPRPGPVSQPGKSAAPKLPFHFAEPRLRRRAGQGTKS